MGYPQIGTNQPVPVQEPVSGVILQALTQYEDVERRLLGLRERLQMGPCATARADDKTRPPAGLVENSNALRNVSHRLQELCKELEDIL